MTGRRPRRSTNRPATGEPTATPMVAAAPTRPASKKPSFRLLTTCMVRASPGAGPGTRDPGDPPNEQEHPYARDPHPPPVRLDSHVVTYLHRALWQQPPTLGVM